MPDNDMGLNRAGARLWSSLLAQDASLEDETSPMRDVALEACRAKDRCDMLDEICRTEPVMLDNGRGQPVAHPAWVEARQQSALLARLVAALRLPDEATGRRPQKRQLRGVQQPSGKVSSLDRARQAKAGA